MQAYLIHPILEDFSILLSTLLGGDFQKNDFAFGFDKLKAACFEPKFHFGIPISYRNFKDEFEENILKSMAT